MPRLTAVPSLPSLRIALAAAGAALLGVIYVFLATAGHMTQFPHVGGGYYEQLAVAFADGHVDLIQRPDGTQSGEDVTREYWDLSLYGGKLYLYWGPVPALLGAALLRTFAVHATDGQWTVTFALVRALFGAILLVRAKQQFFPVEPWLPTCLGVATLAFGAPLTLVCARPAVYEAAIVAGQCFLVAATYLAFVALTRPRDAATRILFFVAGGCLALAVASRVGQLLTAIALAGLTLAETFADTPKKRRVASVLSDGAALTGPLAGTLIALGLYNRARFGSLFDTGLHRQLSFFSFHSGARFVVPNLYTYLAKPPLIGPSFPFFRVAPWEGFVLWRWMPALSLHSTDTYFEPNVGFLWTTPFYAFAAIAWLALGRWTCAALRRRDLTVIAPVPRLAWCIAASLALWILGMLPCLVAFGSTARYAFDGTAGLAIAATLGLSLLVARPSPRRSARRLLVACSTAAVMVSVVVNLALWIEGPYGGFLSSENGALYGRLSQAFSGGPGT